jgi:RNA polymerase sigma factor (TIGR02999 family)
MRNRRQPQVIGPKHFFDNAIDEWTAAGVLTYDHLPMSTASGHEVTELLLRWSAGDPAALDRLIPLVYEQLHRLARRQMARERPSLTLQPTALVNETYMRLIDASQVQWKDRAHFLAISARLMRQVLVDFARSRQNLKRGAGGIRISLTDALQIAPAGRVDLVALDDALQALAALDPRRCQVVELRFFSGLNVEETAEVLEVSPETVKRDWRLAKVWLLRELRKPLENDA